MHIKNVYQLVKLIGLVESERHIGGEITIERRYFISSLENNARQFGAAVRKYWRMENSLHWVFNVAFREDESRVRKGFSPEYMAILRHIALNILKQETSLRCGIKTKRT
ncbi:MAG: ISAs1 family transposase [Gammaproteobacteria bacterium]|nr:ISAs1 family transposase [Gammaproteobacteria bacterium]